MEVNIKIITSLLPRTTKYKQRILLVNMSGVTKTTLKNTIFKMKTSINLKLNFYNLQSNLTC